MSRPIGSRRIQPPPGTDPVAGDGRRPDHVLDVAVVVESDAWQEIAGLEQAIVDAARRAFRAADAAPAGARGVTVALLDDAEVRRLNGQFRSQDKPTNVLSFPVLATDVSSSAGTLLGDDLDDDAEQTIGDIALAYETVAREAAEGRIAPIDHVRHLVVHGVLHLLGYDHETDAEAERMEALETHILTAMGIADPYAR